MMSMPERYEVFYQNFERLKYKDKVETDLTKIYLNYKIENNLSKVLRESFSKEVLKNKLKKMFINIIYDINNFSIIKEAVSELLKEEDFKKEIIKIIKLERKPKKIFNLLAAYFSKKFDKNFDIFYKRYLDDKFLCPRNFETMAKALAQKLTSEDIINFVKENYPENGKYFGIYKEKLKNKLLSLPYDYKINSWFEDYFESSEIKLNNFFNKKDNIRLLLNDHLKTLFLNTLYELIENDSFLNSYAKEFKIDFLNNKSKLKIFLKSLIFEPAGEILKKIKKKRFNCFYLDIKMFNIDNDILKLYLKELLNRQKIDEIWKVLLGSMQ